jgi:para-aminobenzoate synthetase component I
MESVIADTQVHEHTLIAKVIVLNINEFEHQLNQWGRERVPFLFMIDFEMRKPWLKRLSDLNEKELLFDVNGFTNARSHQAPHVPVTITKFPSEIDSYKVKFDMIYQHLCYGDSYLTNLTVKTEIKITASLREIFYLSQAKYKLLYNDQFLVFSPEIFVKMKDGLVFSYPMKGTIDANVDNAQNLILNDEKELAEHVTIVDLIRNDLSQIAEDVNVTRFRYVDRIKTNDKDLLQVSSEIVGKLPPDYQANLGSLLLKLLPAGSVSGAPKQKTTELIRQAEGEDRGYYTGVFGVFDGTALDSGVMIRFIERHGDRYYYRSGGGITTQSVCELEFQEVIDKVYVPVN